MLTRTVIAVFSLACGLAVATIYFSQPLLDTVATEFGISTAQVGIVLTLTQCGYAIGLLTIVPLGDALNRRRLILAQTVLLAIALLSVGFSHSATIFLISATAVGVLAVVTQVMVSYTAVHAPPGGQGAAVGMVTGGIITGILLARTISGTLSDLLGWRSVYFVAAAAVLATALALWSLVPDEHRSLRDVPYGQLLTSTLGLFRSHRELRFRATIAMLIFASITTLLTPMVLPLIAAPYHLSHTEVGLFGLAGAAGALGAIKAGSWCDTGHTEHVTGVGLVGMVLAWAAAATLHWSLWGLIVAVVVIDFALQSVHVANQSAIYRLDPALHSRLTAAYMTFYSVGSAIGAIASTLVYSSRGWFGVCALGGAISLVALVYWFTGSIRRAPAQAPGSPRTDPAPRHESPAPAPGVPR